MFKGEAKVESGQEILFIYLFIYFKLLEHSWFTILCQFQVFSIVSQLYIYTYPLFLDSFSI